MQYSNVADLVGANVRLRYNFGEGNDIWLVYDEGLNTDRGQVVPRLPRTAGRTLLMKYNHTFVW